MCKAFLSVQSFINCIILGLLFYPAFSFADTDLVLSNDISPTPIVVGGSTYIYLSVSNFGVDTAQDTVLTGTLPTELSLLNISTTLGSCTGTDSLSCSLGTVTAGDLSVRAVVTLEVTANQVGSINTAFAIISSTNDVNTTNNNTTATVESVALENSADMNIAYGLMPFFAYQSGTASIPIEVTNNGPAFASQLKFNFSITPLTLSSFISAGASQGTCTTALTNCVGIACVAALQSPIEVDCDLGGLVSGSLASVTIEVTATGEVGEILQAAATIESVSVADPNQLNNTRSTSIEVIAKPDVEGGTGPGGCFIATAAYGSDLADEVQLLREFRDNTLLTFHLGRTFVDAYYYYSPPLAHIISQNESLRALVRGLLLIPVTFIRFPFASTIIIFLLNGATLWLILHKIIKPVL